MAVVTTSRASMCGPLIREETKKKKKSQDPSQKDKKPQTGQSYFGVQTQTLTHSHTHTLTHSHTSSLFGGKQDQSFNRPATDRCRQNTPIISSSLRAAKRQKKTNKNKQKTLQTSTFHQSETDTLRMRENYCTGRPLSSLRLRFRPREVRSFSERARDRLILSINFLFFFSFIFFIYFCFGGVPRRLRSSRVRSVTFDILKT